MFRCTEWFSKYLGDHATVSRFSLSLGYSIFPFDYALLTPFLVRLRRSYLLQGSFHSMEFQSRPWRGLATRAFLFFARRDTLAQRKKANRNLGSQCRAGKQKETRRVRVIPSLPCVSRLWTTRRILLKIPCRMCGGALCQLPWQLWNVKYLFV